MKDANVKMNVRIVKVNYLGFHNVVIVKFIFSLNKCMFKLQFIFSMSYLTL